MKIKHFSKLIAAVVICQFAGIVGSFFTAPAIPGWYETLVRPALNPPSWVFGPVWLTLYFLMGISLYLVWQKGLKRKEVQIAMSVFGVQLVLNATWSVLFFGLQNPALALVDIVLLWFSILFSILFFKLVTTNCLVVNYSLE